MKLTATSCFSLQVAAALGEPIKGYGETTRRGRRRHVRYFKLQYISADRDNDGQANSYLPTPGFLIGGGDFFLQTIKNGIAVCCGAKIIW